MGARKLLIAFMVFFVLVSSASAEAGQEPIEIVVTGYAVIQEDLAHALDVAIRDAMRRGIEQALGSYLDSHTWVSNFDLVEDSILSKATGYISSYSIKDQWVDEGLINVVLLMIIQQGRFENDVNALKVAIQRKGNPRIAVLIPQQCGSSLLAGSPAEPIIIEGLIAAGFLVVNDRPLSYDYYSSEVSRALAGDTQAIIHLADVLNAELLVLGVAKASPVGNIHGLESYRGNVEVRIIDASSSYLLATHSTNEPGLGLNTEDAARVAISNAELFALSFFFRLKTPSS